MSHGATRLQSQHLLPYHRLGASSGPAPAMLNPAIASTAHSFRTYPKNTFCTELAHRRRTRGTSLAPCMVDDSRIALHATLLRTHVAVVPAPVVLCSQWYVSGIGLEASQRLTSDNALQICVLHCLLSTHAWMRRTMVS